MITREAFDKHLQKKMMFSVEKNGDVYFACIKVCGEAYWVDITVKESREIALDALYNAVCKDQPEATDEDIQGLKLSLGSEEWDD